MKLLIFGPPGAGKGIYGSKLKEKFGLEKIATGDIFREEIKAGTELGKKVQTYLANGELVPDSIVIDVVKNKIRGKNNFLLDGFPRTIDQAKALDKITKIDAIIKINTFDEILIEKISARRICSNPKCDGNYNIADIHKTINGIKFDLPPLLPKKDMICDKCGSPLIQRPDDKPEVIKERLKVYKTQSEPVLKYYEGKVPFIEVWMNREPNAIVEEIVQKIQALKLK
ncbi:MAG: adenylate kinase family protein [Candidatus Nanoarchaeia archaeon]